MATIFNVHGYTTMKNCLDTIRTHVQVCAYKALCAAVSPSHDPSDESWYPEFLEEDRKITKIWLAAKNGSPKKGEDTFVDVPIAYRDNKNNKSTEPDERCFIHTCSELDMQAVMKIFYYRQSYLEKVAVHFDIDNQNKFTDICSKLIKYRNTEFAHISAKTAEQDLANMTAEKEQETIAACNKSIKLFFSFLQYFPNLSLTSCNDSENSFYNRAHNKWCAAKEQLLIEEVELETLIQQENLSVDVETLKNICTDCGITVVIPEGNPYIITADYKKAVMTIRAMAQMQAEKKESLQSKAEMEKRLEELRTVAQTNQSQMEKKLEAVRTAAWTSQAKMENELEKTQAEANSKHKLMGTVIGLFAGFIGILVLILVLMLGRDGSNKPTENTLPPQTQQPSVSDTTPSTTETPATTAPAYNGTAFISGSGSYAGLTFQVNQMKSSGILINYTNDGMTDYSLGWVGGSQVDVKTSVGTFTVSTGNGNQKILKNTSGSFAINLGQELMGEVLSITVRDIRPLSSSVLPDGTGCTIEIPIHEGSPMAPEPTVSKVIRGETTYGGLTLTIDQKLSGGIVVKYENDDDKAYSLGWVQNAKVQIKTSEANVEAQVAKSTFKIDKDTTGSFVIEVKGEISGTVEEIVIHNVNALSKDGLPSFSQKDKTIHIPITQTEE